MAPRDSREKLSFENQYTSSVELYHYTSLSKVASRIPKILRASTYTILEDISIRDA